ncbi:MAG: oligopeptide/dipeptide ABC transporter ATP-binding protein [Rubrivivax sp.]
MSVAPAVIEAVGLSKHFAVRRQAFWESAPAPVPAVDAVDLRIAAGETLGLVGESGCGKSTVGRLLLALLPPTQGSVLFEGRDLTRLSADELRPLRRGMQMIFQDPNGALNPRMTVERIVTEPLVIHGARRDAALRARARELLELVGLQPEHASRFPHEFSGGQRQRIGIARALALQPKLLVCDEPVSALDVSVQAQIVNLLQDLQQRFGIAYLFVGHDLAVVRHISHRVAVMYLGRIVESADRRRLYDTPLHPYTQALIASVPPARPRRQRPPAALAGDPASSGRPAQGCVFQRRCPQAVERCRSSVPPLVDVSPGHAVACHLVVPAASSPERSDR